MTASGTSGSYTSNTVAYKQSVEAGEQVSRGQVITVYFSDRNIADNDSDAIPDDNSDAVEENDDDTEE